MSRPRTVLLLLLLAAMGIVAGACGNSESGEQASSSTDVNQLLTETFSGSKQVKSGNLDASLKLASTGGGSSQIGDVSIRLAGPFQSEDDGKLPKFHLDAAFDAGGQSIKAGATSTGEKGFLSFQGTDYVVDDRVFEQFKAGFEQAQKQDSKNDQSLATLGMDPRKWLTNPQNAGEAKVGDDDTIKIIGGVDVARLLDDVNNALEKASSLGLGGGAQLPEKLTEQQKREATEAIKDPRVEIYSGKDDKILRRLVVNLGVDDKSNDATGTVALDIAISDLNEDQDIAEPTDAKPFSDLVGQLRGLGLGAAGGGASSSGGSAPSGGHSSEDLDKFSECLKKAGEDADKARKCAELLSG